MEHVHAVGWEKKPVADAVEEIWTTSCIVAIDNSPLWVIIKTLCLKEGGAIAMVEQLPPTLTAIAGVGDDASDACDMVEGLACFTMRNVGAGDRISTCDHTKPTFR